MKHWGPAMFVDFGLFLLALNWCLLTAPLLFWGVNPWLVALSFVPGITAAGTMFMIATIGTGVRAGTGDK